MSSVSFCPPSILPVAHLAGWMNKLEEYLKAGANVRVMQSRFSAVNVPDGARRLETVCLDGSRAPWFTSERTCTHHFLQWMLAQQDRYVRRSNIVKPIEVSAQKPSHDEYAKLFSYSPTEWIIPASLFFPWTWDIGAVSFMSSHQSADQFLRNASFELTVENPLTRCLRTGSEVPSYVSEHLSADLFLVDTSPVHRLFAGAPLPHQFATPISFSPRAGFAGDTGMLRVKFANGFYPPSDFYSILFLHGVVTRSDT